MPQDYPNACSFLKSLTIEKLAIELKSRRLELKMTNHEFEEGWCFEVEELDFECLTDERIEEVYNLLLH
ncbi:hypothetical protein CW304_09270 [Bacillus sp. UFRGS-B20]|nr:hypothetical protein CW304_09270 [Bacillus sp. UFRGS-B20]